MRKLNVFLALAIVVMLAVACEKDWNGVEPSEKIPVPTEVQITCNRTDGYKIINGQKVPYNPNNKMGTNSIKNNDTLWFPGTGTIGFLTVPQTNVNWWMNPGGLTWTAQNQIFPKLVYGLSTFTISGAINLTFYVKCDTTIPPPINKVGQPVRFLATTTSLGVKTITFRFSRQEANKGSNALTQFGYCYSLNQASWNSPVFSGFSNCTTDSVDWTMPNIPADYVGPIRFTVGAPSWYHNQLAGANGWTSIYRDATWLDNAGNVQDVFTVKITANGSITDCNGNAVCNFNNANLPGNGGDVYPNPEVRLQFDNANNQVVIFNAPAGETAMVFSTSNNAYMNSLPANPAWASYTTIATPGFAGFSQITIPNGNLLKFNHIQIGSGNPFVPYTNFMKLSSLYNTATNTLLILN
jgi:hypothetical protein